MCRFPFCHVLCCVIYATTYLNMYRALLGNFIVEQYKGGLASFYL